MRTTTRRGTTLIETILAVTIAASAIVLATTFALNGIGIGNDLQAQQDFNAAFRRMQREFGGDTAQATRFHFGYTANDRAIPAVLAPLEVQQELIYGYTNTNDEQIWIHYGAKPSTGTGTFYLLKTSNELDGINYQTTILASNVEGLTFSFYNVDGAASTLASEIRRVDMQVSLANANVKRSLTFTGVLRATNEGTLGLPSGVDFGAIEDANFLR